MVKKYPKLSQPAQNKETFLPTQFNKKYQVTLTGVFLVTVFLMVEVNKTKMVVTDKLESVNVRFLLLYCSHTRETLLM